MDRPEKLNRAGDHRLWPVGGDYSLIPGVHFFYLPSCSLCSKAMETDHPGIGAGDNFDVSFYNFFLVLGQSFC